MRMISSLLARNCFDPEATKVMGDVFDEMMRSLDRFGRPRIIQETLARLIIEAAQDGERDPDLMYQRVLAAMAPKIGLVPGNAAPGVLRDESGARVSSP